MEKLELSNLVTNLKLIATSWAAVGLAHPLRGLRTCHTANETLTEKQGKPPHWVTLEMLGLWTTRHQCRLVLGQSPRDLPV